MICSKISRATAVTAALLCMVLQCAHADELVVDTKVESDSVIELMTSLSVPKNQVPVQSDMVDIVVAGVNLGPRRLSPQYSNSSRYANSLFESQFAKPRKAKVEEITIIGERSSARDESTDDLVSKIQIAEAAFLQAAPFKAAPFKPVVFQDKPVHTFERLNVSHVPADLKPLQRADEVRLDQIDFRKIVSHDDALQQTSYLESEDGQEMFTNDLVHFLEVAGFKARSSDPPALPETIPQSFPPLASQESVRLRGNESLFSSFNKQQDSGLRVDSSDGKTFESLNDDFLAKITSTINPSSIENSRGKPDSFVTNAQRKENRIARITNEVFWNDPFAIVAAGVCFAIMLTAIAAWSAPAFWRG